MSILAPQIDEESFLELFELSNKHRWLNISQNALIELWNFCDIKSQRQLLKELLNRFILLDSYDLDDIGKQIYQEINNLSLPMGRTYFVAVADGTEVDGSVTGLDMIRNKFPSTGGWKSSYFISNLIEFAHSVDSNSNVILFDDFIGSGTKICRKLEYFLNKIKERKVRIPFLMVVSFAAMEFGIQKIKKEYSVHVFAPKKIKRGITDYNNEHDTIEKKEIMLSLEEKLKPKFKGLKLKQHKFGYKESEALFGFHGKNCPNNVFPIFWWPEDIKNKMRNTILTRIR